MDLQSLTNLFATTLSPDPNVRKAGEIQIRKISTQEGLITALLQIVASDNVDLSIKQAITVWVKNTVRKSYVPSRPEIPPIAQSDKESLKAHILTLLAASPNRNITVQLSAILKDIVSADYPERWPTLLEHVKSLLLSNDIRQVLAGCFAALEAVRAFRFRQEKDVLPKIIEELMPILVNIATQMLQSPPTPEQQIPLMLHLILKTYKTSVLVNLSDHQQSHDSLVPWGQLLFAVVNLKLPKEIMPEDPEQRERNEWWKAKKWAYSTLNRLFHKYGNPSQLPSPMQKQYGAFSQHFVTTFAPEILKVYLEQVQLYVTGQEWLSERCQYNAFQFFTECVKPKSTWILLKPHYERLITSFVFPQMCFTPAKQEQWDSDPIDFIRNCVDEYVNYSTPVSSATTFLFSLASNRTKTTFLTILGFINNVLASNPAPAQRYGALNMIAALGPFIMRHPDLKGSMEQFVLQHVSPAFSMQEPYLRSIACEVIGTVEKSGLAWSNPEHLKAQFQAVINAMDDSHLPVKVQASLALTEMMMAHESVKEAATPIVGKIVQDLLKLSDETDLDLLNRSMEVVVELYQTELLPVAAQLTSRLCETYLRLAKESLAQDEIDAQQDFDSINLDGNDDKTYAAMGICKTIYTIISSIDSSPDILSQIQEVVIPIIVFTLENRMLDLYDQMYDLVDNLTFKLRRISPTMWPVFELTYKLFKSDAIDFLDEMLPSLDNFVSYGTDVFRTRSDYRSMVVDIYTTSITSDSLGENDRVNGCKLAESILLNLRGQVDDSLETIIRTALDSTPETSAHKLANLEVLINAIFYNPAAALHIMEAIHPGSARSFLDRWFAAINNVEKGLPRVHDKKLTILTLCALLDMEPSSVPASLQEGWAGIVGGILTVFKGYAHAVQERKKLQDELILEEEDDEDLDEKILNLADEEEDVWDEDSAYLEMLAQEGSRLRKAAASAGGIAAEDGEDDDEDDDDDIEEELSYISPLDTVDPYVVFKRALTNFQTNNAPLYQASTTALDIEKQTLLMEVMRIAESAEGAVAPTA
jgi:hypothetical protein